jgi:NitT/TauT family transport system ATP-binding protein
MSEQSKSAMTNPAGASANGAAISMRDVSKTFFGPTNVHALDNISCDIKECEFVSILGPSGCGKSTALRIMAGLLDYQGGPVEVVGKEVYGAVDDAGVVFQTSNLLPWRTVTANLTLGLEMGKHKMSPTDTKAESERMLQMLGLTDFADCYPHELSGGMKQRVAIGQQLMLKPKVLLMDEPFGALDALTRDHMNVELLRIWQHERKTVVLVTHSIAEAIFLSDRVLVMSERPGRFVEDVKIDLPRPRDPSITRQDPKFGAYVVQLSEIMGIV